MQEIRIPSLGWEDSLEEAMATHSSILACGIPWTEEPGGLPSMHSKESDTTEQLTLTELNFSWSMAKLYSLLQGHQFLSLNDTTELNKNQVS